MTLRPHTIFISLCLVILYYSSLAWAGKIANPIPELAKKIELSEFSVENMKLLGIQKKAYLGPNELVPARMLSITKFAPFGVYFGVGTERCLMTAAINPQINFLVMGDYDPRVVFYNQINLALIRLAKVRATYLRLRLESSFEEWQILLSSESSSMDEDDLDLLSEKETFNWWVKAVRIKKNEAGNDSISHDSNMEGFQSENRAKLGYSENEFKDANYLFEDRLFQRVYELAHTGMIQVSLIHLERIEDVEKLVKILKQKDMSLSLFDFSNTWWPQYNFGFDRLYQVITQLLPISSQNTLFMGTTSASLVDSWSTSYGSIIQNADGTQERKIVEYNKGEGYPLNVNFTYFGAHLVNLVNLEEWKQFEQTLLDWRKGSRPLSSEVERVDSHLLNDWRLLDLRSSLVPDHGGWRIVLND